MSAYDPICDIPRTEISRRSSLLQLAEVCYSLLKHGSHRAVKRRAFITLLGGVAAVAAQGARSPMWGSKDRSRMMFHSCVAQTAILATALALVTAALNDHAFAGGKLDASYTISFARIRVGDITATGLFGESEYAISARGRAGGIMKQLNLVDGEASFSTHGIIKDGYPVPTTFTSKTVSDAETSDVTMVLDEGSVKELAAAVPPPKSDRVPVTQTNRKGIVDPLTAMLFSAAAVGEGLARDVCRQTLPIFDGQQRYDLKLAFKRMDKITAERGYAGPVVVCSVSYEPIAGHRPSTRLVKYLSEGREMEMALAPIAGTRLLAPFRMLVESALANLVIEANQFEVTAQPQDARTVADPKAQ